MSARQVFVGVVVIGLVCGLGVEASARSTYLSRVPTSFSCSTCHVNPRGGGSRNPFGMDFDANGRGWATVCDLDSDGDGFTNGEELGDPGCAWAPGQMLPFGEPTRPGDPGDFPGASTCGDGVLDDDEQCDGDAGGATCEALDAGTGEVTCAEDCTFDVSACVVDANNAGNNTGVNNAGNNVAGNNAAANNAGNNAAANNAGVNNAGGNNGNNAGANPDDDPFVEDDGDEDGGGGRSRSCSIAPPQGAGTPLGWLVVVGLGAWLWRRRR